MDMITYAAQGMCVLSMDCRGQNGQSQDAAVYPEGHHIGWMTQGIRDPRSYYYRYVYADALRALEPRRDSTVVTICALDWSPLEAWLRDGSAVSDILINGPGRDITLVEQGQRMASGCRVPAS